MVEATSISITNGTEQFHPVWELVSAFVTPVGIFVAFVIVFLIVLHIKHNSQSNHRKLTQNELKAVFGKRGVRDTPSIRLLEDDLEPSDPFDMDQALSTIHAILSLSESALKTVWKQKKKRVWMPSLLSLPSAVNAVITGRDAGHSQGVLPHHHVILSEYNVRFLGLVQAISRKEYERAGLDYFRYLDIGSGHHDGKVTVDRLKKSPFIRICAEQGMGKSSALVSAFALVMGVEGCRYRNIALTYIDNWTHARVIYDRYSREWMIQPLAAHGDAYKINDDTLHFLDVPEFQRPNDNSVPAENYLYKFTSVRRATSRHVNSKTLMVSSTPQSITLVDPLEPKRSNNYAALAMLINRVVSAQEHGHVLPLVYVAELSYPAHFCSFILSTMTRRYEAGISLGHTVNECCQEMIEMWAKRGLEYYQPFFPARPRENDRLKARRNVSDHSLMSSIRSTDSTNPLNWRNASPSGLNTIKSSNNAEAEAQVAKAHLEYLQQWAELKLEIEPQLRSLDPDDPIHQPHQHDHGNNVPVPTRDGAAALAWIKAHLESGRLGARPLSRYIHLLEKLYFELKSTLPWDEFAATVQQDVTALAAYAPTLLAMQFALSPVRVSPILQSLQVSAHSFRTTDQFFDWKTATWQSSASSPLLP